MKLPSWHRTKIVCTLGPATDAPGVLEQLIAAGMDVARVNLSHGSHADHARRIRDVRDAATRLEQPVAILSDLPGPKFRLAVLAEGHARLEPGADLTLGLESGGATLPVRDEALLDALQPDEAVYLADGAVELRVLEKSGGSVTCRVVIGGTVRSGSGINVPDSELGAVVPTADDRRHLAFVLEQGVEWIGVSFVQSADDLTRVRACFSAPQQALVMAKIEKRRALANLDEIVAAADGIMVARGDLGVETDLAQIPLVQKRMIATANAKSRPIVTATQMLESMIENEHPTRAEVTDVANALLDGTDAVMLSGETAVGRHPGAAVDILRRVLEATEAEHARAIAIERLRALEPAEDAVSYAACQLAAATGARAIIAAVNAFDAVTRVARFRPDAPLMAVTASQRLARALAAVRGVAPVCAGEAADQQTCLRLARDWLFARGLARSGDRAVLLVATAPGTGADTVRLVRLD